MNRRDMMTTLWSSHTGPFRLIVGIGLCILCVTIAVILVLQIASVAQATGSSGQGAAFIPPSVETKAMATPQAPLSFALTLAWVQESNQAGAEYGFSVATAGDVNADGYDDIIVGARLYDNGQEDEGRAFLYLGSRTGIATTPSWIAESNQAGAMFGASVASAGDVNGDGFDDVIVGARYYDSPAVDGGRIYLYLGGPGGLSATPAWTVALNQAGAQLGVQVASAGDVNGDGYSDIIAGAFRYDGAYADEGAAYVWYGSQSGIPAHKTTANADWVVRGGSENVQLGYSVASAGDVNRDGYNDVIIGMIGYTNGQRNEGGARVYLGSATGLRTTPVWVAESNQVDALFGVSVSAAGDVNGDGFDDVLVGAFWHDNRFNEEGRAFLYLGAASGVRASPAWIFDGGQPAALLGNIVASAGDLNGDGFGDIVVNASSYQVNYPNEGGVFVFLGSAAGLQTTPDWIGKGGQAGAQFGLGVAGAGDVNGDGVDDLIVGARKYHGGQVDEGRAYVYLGPTPTPPTLTPTPTRTPTPSRTVTPTITPTATSAFGRIRGVVFHDANQNEQPDPGEGLPGALLSLSGPTSAQVTSAADGSYLFSFLLPGSYVLTETPPPGYGPARPTSVAALIVQANSTVTWYFVHDPLPAVTPTPTPTSTRTPTPTRAPTATASPVVPPPTRAQYLPFIARIYQAATPYLDTEPNDSLAQARGPLISGQSYQFDLGFNGDEQDYFFFEMSSAHTIEVWMTQIPATASFHLYLFDDKGDRIGYSGNPGSADEHIVTEVLNLDRCYIRARWVSGSGSYTLRVVYQD